MVGAHHSGRRTLPASPIAAAQTGFAKTAAIHSDVRRVSLMNLCDSDNTHRALSTKRRSFGQCSRKESVAKRHLQHMHRLPSTVALPRNSNNTITRLLSQSGRRAATAATPKRAGIVRFAQSFAHSTIRWINIPTHRGQDCPVSSPDISLSLGRGRRVALPPQNHG